MLAVLTLTLTVTFGKHPSLGAGRGSDGEAMAHDDILAWRPPTRCAQEYKKQGQEEFDKQQAKEQEDDAGDDSEAEGEANGDGAHENGEAEQEGASGDEASP